MSIPTGQHLAAIIPSKGSPLQLTYRPTPTPGPDELLIEVKSFAVNPVDYYMREVGFVIASYPAVIGSDIAGVVVSAGSSVPPDAPKPGTRVTALAPSFWTKGAADYGAFQTHVLVPAENAAQLPQGTSFNEGSVFPLAVVTAWIGWYSIGVANDTVYTPADKQAILVWGGASSVGTAVVQIAKLRGYTVYTTASGKHHECLKRLGASRTFDYRDEHAVERIVKAAKEDGLTLQTAYYASGDQLKECLEVVKQLNEKGGKVASAVPLSENPPTAEGVEVAFVAPPVDVEKRKELLHFVFVWLKEKLETGEFVPSPKIQVVEGGLASANKALDEWKGVSGTKIVVEI